MARLLTNLEHAEATQLHTVAAGNGCSYRVEDRVDLLRIEVRVLPCDAFYEFGPDHAPRLPARSRHHKPSRWSPTKFELRIG